ncbi:hypothetical protein [Altererythrobacter sp. MF3-039]|uniref:hypothetical protein n=1 Tax=Altererythrobacter sp. MF3-039 TaxID=3252901 RepID=UPI00390CC53E
MSIILSIILMATGPQAALAQGTEEGVLEDEPVKTEQGERVACIAGQVIVPPFNNTPAAMDQSRIAATAVMRSNARSGSKSVRVCQTSAVSPEISELKHGNEVPVDPEYEPEDAPEAATTD